MKVIDACFLIAYYNKNDVFHKRAIEISKEFIANEDELIILDHVFDEVMGVVLNRLKDMKKIKIIGKDILSTIGITHIREDTFHKAWDIFLGQDGTRFSFTDCIIRSYLEQYRIKDLVTFDKEFSKVYGINVIS